MGEETKGRSILNPSPEMGTVIKLVRYGVCRVKDLQKGDFTGKGVTKMEKSGENKEGKKKETGWERNPEKNRGSAEGEKGINGRSKNGLRSDAKKKRN